MALGLPWLWSRKALPITTAGGHRPVHKLVVLCDSQFRIRKRSEKRWPNQGPPSHCMALQIEQAPGQGDARRVHAERHCSTLGPGRALHASLRHPLPSCVELPDETAGCVNVSSEALAGVEVPIRD